MEGIEDGSRGESKEEGDGYCEGGEGTAGTGQEGPFVESGREEGHGDEEGISIVDMFIAVIRNPRDHL